MDNYQHIAYQCARAGTSIGGPTRPPDGLAGARSNPACWSRRSECAGVWTGQRGRAVCVGSARTGGQLPLPSPARRAESRPPPSLGQPELPVPSPQRRRHSQRAIRPDSNSKASKSLVVTGSQD